MNEPLAGLQYSFGENSRERGIEFDQQTWPALFDHKTWSFLVLTVMPSNPLLSGGFGKWCAIVS